MTKNCESLVSVPPELASASCPVPLNTSWGLVSLAYSVTYMRSRTVPTRRANWRSAGAV